MSKPRTHDARLGDAVKLSVVWRRSTKYWKPARWWSPGRAHFRFGPVVVAVPRRWWPAKKDGVRRCPMCRRTVWMEGPPNCWCDECRLSHRQIQSFLRDEPWWDEKLRRVLRHA